jgi:hypothetical protein
VLGLSRQYTPYILFTIEVNGTSFHNKIIFFQRQMLVIQVCVARAY